MANSIKEWLNEIESLKVELEQQKFNNKHNLSIDQQISDELLRLREDNSKLRDSLIRMQQITPLDYATLEDFVLDLRFEMQKALNIGDN